MERNKIIMLGGIIGDIIGSRFEFNNIKTKKFELLNPKCFFTDDSVMTLAIGKALKICKGDYTNLSDIVVKQMQNLGRKYPYCGYGERFNHWVHSDNPKPYNSFGNGAAMRVSACGIFGKTVEEVKYLAKKVTEVTHNHPEGLKAAEVTSVCVFLARQGKSKKEIYDYAKQYYSFDFILDMIRKTYTFDVTCQGTMPVALVAFFDSTSFEDAIRNAISVGGDSDTIACITGSIAGQFYKIPDKIKDSAIKYLDKYLYDIYHSIVMK